MSCDTELGECCLHSEISHELNRISYLLVQKINVIITMNCVGCKEFWPSQLDHTCWIKNMSEWIDSVYLYFDEAIQQLIKEDEFDNQDFTQNFKEEILHVLCFHILW